MGGAKKNHVIQVRLVWSMAVAPTLWFAPTRLPLVDRALALFPVPSRGLDPARLTT